MQLTVTYARKAGVIGKPRTEREIVSLWILPRPVHQIIHPQDGDIVEHERGDDLVHAVPRSQPGWDQRPRGTDREPGNEHAGQQND